MESIEVIRAFFGWCIVLHAAVLVSAWAMLMVGGEWVRGMHSRMFGLADQDLSRLYIQFLAFYKVGIWLLAIVPWVALHPVA